MMNTLLTLPLDVLASKKQAATATPSTLANNNNNNKNENNSTLVDETQDESETSCVEDRITHTGDVVEGLTLVQQQQLKMDEVWKNLDGMAANSNVTRGGDVFYDSCSEEQPVSSSSSFDSQDSTTTAAKEEEEEKEEQEEEQKEEHDVVFDEQQHLTLTVTTTTTTTSLHAPASYHDNNKLLPFETEAENINNTRTNTKISSKNRRPETTTITPSSPSSVLSQVPSLWKGLYPSLLLCSNPSIHYTVFDVAKSYLLQAKTTTTKRVHTTNLSMKEAFVLGLFAKFCATIATYPLIRAKVMLMVTSRNSMIQTLVENYQQDGFFRGWYKGCSVQLLHTVLKSALLMMVKERIATTTHQLLVPPPTTTITTPASSSSSSSITGIASRS